MSSSEYQSITAYQLTEKGKQVLSKIPTQQRQQVDEHIYAPQKNNNNTPSYSDRDLLEVSWDGESFYLRSKSGYSRASTITEPEGM